MRPGWGQVLFALGGTLIVCATLAHMVFRSNPGRSRPMQDATAREVAGPPHRADVSGRTGSRHPFRVGCGPAEPDAASTASAVSGRVLDESGNAAAGVLVTLERQSGQAGSRSATTTTDADGEYWFADQEAGPVVVAVRLDSESAWCAPSPAGLTLAECEESTGVDFRLVRGLSIVGFVDGDHSKPLENAYVSAEILVAAESTETAARKAAHADESGFFEIRSIDPGAKVTKLTAHAPGYRTSAHAPAAPFEIVHEFTLQRLGQVLLLARDSDCSTPLRRFRYRVDSMTSEPVDHPFLGRWTEPTILEAPGEAHLDGVPPGPWLVSVVELTEVGNPTGRNADVLCDVRGGENTVRLCAGMTVSK